MKFTSGFEKPIKLIKHCNFVGECKWKSHDFIQGDSLPLFHLNLFNKLNLIGKQRFNKSVNDRLEHIK